MDYTLIVTALTFLSSVIGGIVAGVSVIFSMRVDLEWVKKIVTQHEKRIFKLENGECK